MNILAIVKNGEDKHQLRALINKGHKVIMTSDIENAPYNDIDVVISLSEKSVEDAFNISQQYNIPFYAHIDWIKPWMVFKDSEHNWGYIDKIPFSKKMNFIRKYQNIAMYWSMADVKSMAANCFHQLMKELTGILDMSIYTKHPTLNIGEILKHKSRTKLNKITCVGKFVPYMRIHHLIKALQMIDYDGKLVLIGSGEDKNLYSAIKGNLTIEYCNDLNKYDVISESRLVVALWNGIVPAEALLLNTPVISYDSKYMRELYPQDVIFVQNNSISELARAIKQVLKSTNTINYEYIDDNMLEKLIKKTIRK